MTREAPILALDVDGVLCPVIEPGSPPDAWPKWDSYRGGHISMAEGVADYFRSLELRKQVEVGWLTTWEERAAEELAPRFSLPSWPVLSTREEFLAPGWWKLVTMEKILRTGREVIWVDDDLDYSRKLGELDQFLATGLLTYISPTCTIGLTPEDLRRIDKLLEDR